MRMILMAVVALLLLAGGGYAGYVYFTQPAEAAAPADDAKKDHKKDEHAKQEDGHGGGGSYQYVEMAPLMLPIVDDSGVSQVINLVIALEVADLSTADRVKELQPKFADAFITDMYGVLNRHAALRGGVLQVSIIKERLNRVSDQIMGDEDSVHDVLLQVVQQRPI